MKTKRLSPAPGALLALTLAALACGGGPAVEPSATPFGPTAKPAATRKPTPANAGESPLQLAQAAYDHPSGAFSVTLPDGWEVKDRDFSVFVNAPDSVASIEISFVTTGVELDADGLGKLIDANETNWFAGFDSYAEESREPQNDGSIGVLKTLVLADGTPQTVFSYYWAEGTIVYEQDFWVNTDQYDAYIGGLLDVANSMTTDPQAGSEAPLYAITYTFVDPERGLFQFDVPFAWIYATDTGDNTRIDTFTSPDGLAFVDNIAYDDGQAVSKSDAGDFALILLRKSYDLDDLKVTGDEVQQDGSERLDWTSASRGLRGESFFETHGTTFLLLTWAATAEDYDTLAGVWSNLLDTYQVPES